MLKFISKFFNLKEKILYYEYRYFKIKKKFKIFDNYDLNKNSLILDIGSNVGDVTKYLYEKFKCNIIGFEPNEHAYKLQKARFKNYKKIKIFNVCVDNNSGLKKIFFHKKSKSFGDIEYSHASSLDKNKDNISKNNFKVVRAVSINKILKKFKTIDLIKIDIEGNEYKILPSIINNRNKIKKVLCELHGRPNNKNKDIRYFKKYLSLINKLKEKKLLNSWFIEWA
jgi:FkbM family methyltransferase